MRYHIDAKLAKNPLYDKDDPTTGDPLHAGMIRDGPTDKRGLAMNPDNLSMGINASNQLHGTPPDYPGCGPVILSWETGDSGFVDLGEPVTGDTGVAYPIIAGLGVVGALNEIHGISFLCQSIGWEDGGRAWNGVFAGRFLIALVPEGLSQFDLTVPQLILAQGAISQNENAASVNVSQTIMFSEAWDVTAFLASNPYGGRDGRADVWGYCQSGSFDMLATVYYA